MNWAKPKYKEVHICEKLINQDGRFPVYTSGCLKSVEVLGIMVTLSQDRYCYITVTFQPSHCKEVPALLASSQMLRTGILILTPGLKPTTNREIFN